MATGTGDGAASAAPRHSYDVISSSSPSLPATIRLVTEYEDEDGRIMDVTDRAEVDVEWRGDVLYIEVRRLENDPQVQVVLR